MGGSGASVGSVQRLIPCLPCFLSFSPHFFIIIEWLDAVQWFYLGFWISGSACGRRLVDAGGQALEVAESHGYGCCWEMRGGFEYGSFIHSWWLWQR